MHQRKTIQISFGKDTNAPALNAVFGGPQEELPEDLAHTLVIMIPHVPGDGLTGAKGIFQDLEEGLSLYGYKTIRFDFRGWGKSPGESRAFTLETAHADLEAVMLWAIEQGYMRFFFIAEGLGILPAMRSVNEYVRGLIMLWPALDPAKTYLSKLLPLLESQEILKKGVVEYNGQQIGTVFLNEIKEYDPIPHLQSLSVPLLVQHGEIDDQIPIAQLALLRKYGKNAPRIEITSYEQGQNGLPLASHRSTMLFHIQQFLKKYS